MNCIRDRWSWTVAMTAVFLLVGGSARAQIFTTFDWTNASGGSYNSSSNWNFSGIPNSPFEGARFNIAGIYGVDFPTDISTSTASVRNGLVAFNLDSSGTQRTYTLDSFLVDAAVLEVQDGTVNADAITVSGGGVLLQDNSTLLVGEMGVQSLTSGSRAILGFWSDTVGRATVTGAGSSWTTGGSLLIGGRGTGELTISNGGSLLSSSATMANGSTSLDNHVTVTGAGSTWTSTGRIIIGLQGDATMDILAGGRVTSTEAGIGLASGGATGRVDVSGAGSSWTITDGLSIAGDDFFSSGGGDGRLTVRSGGAASVGQELTLFSGGEVRLMDGGELSAASVAFDGGGTFDWTGGALHVEMYPQSLVNTAGTLAPGQSAGSTTIFGDYTQQNAATLELEIGGTATATQYDFVNVTDDAFLDGTLSLRMLNDFVPDPGQSFVVLNADNLFGNFDNAGNNQRLDTADGRGSFVVNYGPASPFNAQQIVLSAFIASAGIAGDYNGSGQVEQGDLDLVLQNWGVDTDVSGIPLGWINDLPSGQIEQTELDGILQNWGDTSAPDFRRDPVPEPVAGVFVLAIGFWKRSGRRHRAIPDWLSTELRMSQP